MKVTDITDQKKNKDRVNLFLDGAYYCSIAARLVEERRVYIGLEIDGRELERIIFESDRQKAYDMACAYLSKRAATVRTIESKLYERGFGRAVVEYVTEKLKDYGFLDDREFALDYYEARKDGCGIRKIASKLKEKGVSEKDLAAIYENEDRECALKGALKATKKHMAGKAVDEKYLARLYRFLLSRGYDGEIVSECLAYAKGKRDEDLD